MKHIIIAFALLATTTAWAVDVASQGATAPQQQIGLPDMPAEQYQAFKKHVVDSFSAQLNCIKASNNIRQFEACQPKPTPATAPMANTPALTKK